MELTCKQCGAEIDAADVNLDRMIAKCRRCNAVFSFAGMVEGGAERAKMLDVPLPSRFTIEHTGDGLVIARRWLSARVYLMAVMTVFWNGFVLFWIGTVLVARVWPMALFGSLHAGVGLFLLYTTLAGFLNTTTVRVGSSELTVKHGPLPYPGKRLEPGAIRQLFSKRRISHGRNSTTITYELHAVTGDGKHEKLVSGLDEEEQALFLEQEVERYLRIKDQPVRGELAR